jgi:hypothetical protein
VHRSENSGCNDQVHLQGYDPLNLFHCIRIKFYICLRNLILPLQIFSWSKAGERIHIGNEFIFHFESSFT